MIRLLGAFKWISSFSQSDIDNVRDEGYYSSWDNQYGWILLLVFRVSNSNSRMQVMISKKEIKYRYYHNEEWVSWTAISFT